MKTTAPIPSPESTSTPATTTTTTTTPASTPPPPLPPTLYTTRPIGFVSSSYKLCVGTPRQGALAPSSLGTIELDPTFVGPDIVDSLDNFSHIWVLFVFHLNSNVDSHAIALNSSQRGKIFPSKIAPPALGGKKVGVLSTRSPHRPNPVGFTLVHLDKITRPSKHNKRTTLHISGIDLVDGTPVLDIKPYVSQYDAAGWAPGHNTDAAGGVRQPDWIRDGLTLRREVKFPKHLLDDLSEKFFKKQKFYKTEGAVETVVKEILSADVRSSWHTTKARAGGSKAPIVAANGTRREDDVTQTTASTQQIDNFIVSFRILDTEERQSESNDKNTLENEEVQAMVKGSGANDVVVVEAINLVT